MKIYTLLVFLLVFYLGCSSFPNENSTKAHSTNSFNKNSQTEQTKMTNEESQTCENNRTGLQLFVENDDERKAKNIEIKQNDKALSTIYLPSTRVVNDFHLLEAKKTIEGFRFTFEYEDKLIYRKRFVFTCRMNRFFLDTVIQNKRYKGRQPKSFDSPYDNEEFLNLSIPLKSFRIKSFLFEPDEYNERFDSESKTATEIISCDKRGDYSLRVVEDETRRGKYLKPTQLIQNIEIVQNGKVKKTIYLPTGERFQDFELKDIKENDKGFSMTIYWGGQRWSYDYTFHFSCVKGNLNLVKSKSEIYHRNGTDLPSLYKTSKKQFKIPIENVEFIYIMSFIYHAS